MPWTLGTTHPTWDLNYVLILPYNRQKHTGKAAGCEHLRRDRNAVLRAWITLATWPPLMGSQSGASDSNTGRIRPNMEGLRFAIPAKLSSKPENKITSVHTEGDGVTEKQRKTTNSMLQAVSYKWVTAKVSITEVNHKKVPWIALSRWGSRDVEEACQA